MKTLLPAFKGPKPERLQKASDLGDLDLRSFFLQIQR